MLIPEPRTFVTRLFAAALDDDPDADAELRDLAPFDNTAAAAFEALAVAQYFRPADATAEG